MAHPWMANSSPAIKREMLEQTGAGSIAELFSQIPESHRLKEPLRLPRALSAEFELERHLLDRLSRNANCEDNLSFLGAGCWQHYVPAVCDEVYGRSEWLTSVFGGPMSDHGRNQAWFEFCSELGELVGMDMVGLPVYSWGCAAGHAIRMASRLTGRHEVLIPRNMDPERLSVIRNYCEPPGMDGHIAIVPVDFDPETGKLSLEDLQAKISDRTAAVYVETPSYLGVIEDQCARIAELARLSGAEAIFGVDPISLGILEAPGLYGADIAVGPTQPLGVRMQCGGGVGGFIATRDEERYAREFPTLMISITDTIAGERGFGLSLFHQTSYGMREQAKDWTGNSVYMWAVTGAAYMALLGPKGFLEVGNRIIAGAREAAARLARIEGVRIAFPRDFFKEFVVNFDASGRTVAAVDRGLRSRGIFGGRDLTEDFPELGQSALYCVTERHTREDIDRLVRALEEELAS